MRSCECRMENKTVFATWSFSRNISPHQASSNSPAADVEFEAAKARNSILLLDSITIANILYWLREIQSREIG